MAENNGSGKREEAKFDGVVNELRNVLSGLGLGNAAPALEPKAPPAPSPFDDPFSEQERRAPPVEKLAPKMKGNGHSVPGSSEPLASDADFWNGNVLGWPSNADADLPSIPALAETNTEPAPSDNAFFREEPTENNFNAMPLAEEPDFTRLAAAEEPAAFIPPVPEPIEKTPDAWPLLKEPDDVIPAPPLAPASAAAPLAPPPPSPLAPATPPAEAPSADPWLRSGFGLDSPLGEPGAPAPAAVPAAPAARMPEFVIESPAMMPAAPPVESAPAMPLRPAADFEFELPIPGTKETKDPPPAESGRHLELDGTEMKPRDLIQVACIYPEGQEKAGQAFVTRLREAAEKLRAPITVQAVFVSAWSTDKIEPTVWGKSASLSGADVMFVLSFRASANLFRALPEVALKGGPKSRLVLLEQTNFPTLYADILVELRRAR